MPKDTSALSAHQRERVGHRGVDRSTRVGRRFICPARYRSFIDVDRGDLIDFEALSEEEGMAEWRADLQAAGRLSQTRS